MSNSTIENLTMIVNQTKYVIHQDNARQTYNAIVKNCKLIRREDYNDSSSS